MRKAAPTTVSASTDTSEFVDLPREQVFQIMRHEDHRKASFNRWPVSGMSKSEMAAAGFFYSGDRDVVTCAFCRKSFEGWRSSERPLVRHRQFAPYCPYVRGRECGNVPRARTKVPQEMRDVGLTTAGQVTRYPFNYMSLSDMDRRKLLKFEEHRLQTFRYWNKYDVIADDLAAAGFYYTGRDDEVTCAFCDGTCSDWSYLDRPMTVHAEKFPNCGFVLQYDVGNIPLGQSGNDEENAYGPAAGFPETGRAVEAACSDEFLQPIVSYRQSELRGQSSTRPSAVALPPIARSAEKARDLSRQSSGREGSFALRPPSSQHPVLPPIGQSGEYMPLGRDSSRERSAQRRDSPAAAARVWQDLPPSALAPVDDGAQDRFAQQTKQQTEINKMIQTLAYEARDRAYFGYNPVESSTLRQIAKLDNDLDAASFREPPVEEVNAQLSAGSWSLLASEQEPVARELSGQAGQRTPLAGRSAERVSKQQSYRQPSAQLGEPEAGSAQRFASSVASLRQPSDRMAQAVPSMGRSGERVSMPADQREPSVYVDQPRVGSVASAGSRAVYWPPGRDPSGQIIQPALSAGRSAERFAGTQSCQRAPTVYSGEAGVEAGAVSSGKGASRVPSVRQPSGRLDQTVTSIGRSGERIDMQASQREPSAYVDQPRMSAVASAGMYGTLTPPARDPFSQIIQPVLSSGRSAERFAAMQPWLRGPTIYTGEAGAGAGAVPSGKIASREPSMRQKLSGRSGERSDMQASQREPSAYVDQSRVSAIASAGMYGTLTPPARDPSGQIIQPVLSSGRSAERFAAMQPSLRAPNVYSGEAGAGASVVPSGKVASREPSMRQQLSGRLDQTVTSTGRSGERFTTQASRQPLSPSLGELGITGEARALSYADSHAQSLRQPSGPITQSTLPAGTSAERLATQQHFPEYQKSYSERVLDAAAKQSGALDERFARQSSYQQQLQQMDAVAGFSPSRQFTASALSPRDPSAQLREPSPSAGQSAERIAQRESDRQVSAHFLEGGARSATAGEFSARSASVREPSGQLAQQAASSMVKMSSERMAAQPSRQEPSIYPMRSPINAVPTAGAQSGTAVASRLPSEPCYRPAATTEDESGLAQNSLPGRSSQQPSRIAGSSKSRQSGYRDATAAVIASGARLAAEEPLISAQRSGERSVLAAAGVTSSYRQQLQQLEQSELPAATRSSIRSALPAADAAAMRTISQRSATSGQLLAGRSGDRLSATAAAVPVQSDVASDGGGRRLAPASLPRSSNARSVQQQQSVRLRENSDAGGAAKKSTVWIPTPVSTGSSAHSAEYNEAMRRDLALHSTIPGLTPEEQEYLDYMKDPANRLSSYVNWPNPDVDVRRMVAAGLYYSGNGDTVCCPYCDAAMCDWGEEDDPLEIHNQFSPVCPYVYVVMSGQPLSTRTAAESAAATAGVDRQSASAFASASVTRDGYGLAAPQQQQLLPELRVQSPSSASVRSRSSGVRPDGSRLAAPPRADASATERAPWSAAASAAAAAAGGAELYSPDADGTSLGIASARGPLADGVGNEAQSYRDTAEPDSELQTPGYRSTDAIEARTKASNASTRTRTRTGRSSDARSPRSVSGRESKEPGIRRSGQPGSDAAAAWLQQQQQPSAAVIDTGVNEPAPYSRSAGIDGSRMGSAIAAGGTLEDSPSRTPSIKIRTPSAVSPSTRGGAVNTLGVPISATDAVQRSVRESGARIRASGAEWAQADAGTRSTLMVSVRTAAGQPASLMAPPAHGSVAGRTAGSAGPSAESLIYREPSAAASKPSASPMAGAAAASSVQAPSVPAADARFSRQASQKSARTATTGLPYSGCVSESASRHVYVDAVGPSGPLHMFTSGGGPIGSLYQSSEQLPSSLQSAEELLPSQHGDAEGASDGYRQQIDANNADYLRPWRPGMADASASQTPLPTTNYAYPVSERGTSITPYGMLSGDLRPVDFRSSYVAPPVDGGGVANRGSHRPGSWIASPVDSSAAAETASRGQHEAAIARQASGQQAPLPVPWNEFSNSGASQKNQASPEQARRSVDTSRGRSSGTGVD